MDNNTNPVEPPAVSVPTPEPTKSGSEQSSSLSKIMLWLILGFVVIILIVAGFYLVLGKNKSVTKPSQTQTTPDENLEQQVNAIDVASPDSDFKNVDSDLGNL